MVEEGSRERRDGTLSIGFSLFGTLGQVLRPHISAVILFNHITTLNMWIEHSSPVFSSVTVPRCGYAVFFLKKVHLSNFHRKGPSYYKSSGTTQTGGFRSRFPACLWMSSWKQTGARWFSWYGWPASLQDLSLTLSAGMPTAGFLRRLWVPNHIPDWTIPRGLKSLSWENLFKHLTFYQVIVLQNNIKSWVQATVCTIVKLK